MSKYSDRRNAMSAVMALFPSKIAVTLVSGTPISLARL
ncbi:hypothetical protein N825_36405 [Skermanella stibiiresistens SB22]|uniref:Uncharacterized protein n=1 Tax=Skermanella stibiiresistens SB22 TaxID=1385369 RepID=W9H2V2_9PROT|nr:hypothetical protein N825_36405 [Skermanella stibiiresistens SB22]